MSYNVKVIEVSTKALKKEVTYVFLLGGVMSVINKCTSKEQVQEILLSVEKELRRTINDVFIYFGVRLLDNGWVPEITFCGHENIIYTSSYDSGELTITKRCLVRVPCIKVGIEKEVVAQATDTNRKSEE